MRSIKTFRENSERRLVEFGLGEESLGTRKMFSAAAIWLHVLGHGCVIFYDELHNHLHPKLVAFLVNMFHSKETNPNNAQLIFTTHETSILNQEILRRDQIWFCEQGESKATSVVPLTDYSPRKGRENLEAAYLSGRYGALPYVDTLGDIFVVGSDNLHHKRREQASKPARRKGTRPPHDRVLIVCEGKKTEPNYFEELKDHYRLNSADIEIVGTDGASPANILKLAKRKHHAAKRNCNSYDRVYCVFDQDLWPCYGQVLEDILSARPKGTFFAANSAPCFEYWLLLHFEHTRVVPYRQASKEKPSRSGSRRFETPHAALQQGGKELI